MQRKRIAVAAVAVAGTAAAVAFTLPSMAGTSPSGRAAKPAAAEDGITDPHQLQQVVRRTVGRWVNDAYRRRPMIVPTVVEV